MTAAGDAAAAYRQISEELIADLAEYATWLRMMDAPYGRGAVARDLRAIVDAYQARVNDPHAAPQTLTPAAWAAR